MTAIRLRCPDCGWIPTTTTAFATHPLLCPGRPGHASSTTATTPPQVVVLDRWPGHPDRPPGGAIYGR